MAALMFVGLELDGSSQIGRLARRCRGAAVLTVAVVALGSGLA